MKLTIAFLAVLVLGAPAGAGEAESLTVALAMERRVRGVEITVGDVAQVTGADAEAVERVAGVSLGSSPAPGYSRVLRADRVLAAIARALPEAPVRVTGERACRVYPEVEEIAGERIAALARARLDAELAGQDVELELVGSIGAVAVPAGGEALEVRVRPGALPRTGGTLSVPVDVLVDGARYRTIWTAWSVRRWETREVLARGVRAGQALDASLFERRRVPIGTEGASTLDASSLHGAVALRDLRAGELVGATDVRRPTIVVLGQTLFLEVRRGAIEARVPAVALGSGAVGDRIQVRTAENGQELVATIRSRDLCRIDLGR